MRGVVCDVAQDGEAALRRRKPHLQAAQPASLSLLQTRAAFTRQRVSPFCVLAWAKHLKCTSPRRLAPEAPPGAREPPALPQSALHSTAGGQMWTGCQAQYVCLFLHCPVWLQQPCSSSNRNSRCHTQLRPLTLPGRVQVGVARQVGHSARTPAARRTGMLTAQDVRMRTLCTCC